jgi:L-fuculose-phosphate aldolase
MLLQKERESIVEFGRKLIETGLVKGTGGNLSLCNPEKSMLAITPTGLAYEMMKPKDVVVLALDGEHLEGKLKPSSEVAFHLGLVNLRPDIFAVVHTHSPYATTMACLGMELPAIHYLVGFAGESVPVAPYATYGTPELSEHICNSIGTGNAVLMANHGMVAVGSNLARAFTTAEMVEYVAQLYLQAKAVGNPQILSKEEMGVVIDKFETYGQPSLK